MSKETVSLDLVFNEFKDLKKEMAETNTIMQEILKVIKNEQTKEDARSNMTKTHVSIETRETPYKATQIRDALLGTGIIEQNQVTKNKDLFTSLESQVKLCGNATFLNVVTNVSSRIAQGGVRNKLGYFIKSFNEEINKW